MILASKLDPLWTEAKELSLSLESLLLQLTSLVASKGGLKQKQFDKLLSKFDESHLGPLREPYKDPKTENVINLKASTLSELGLKAEDNNEKVCLLKVVAELGDQMKQPPYYCIASDVTGSLCVLSVFNAAPDFHLQRADSVAVAQPNFSHHQFDFVPFQKEEVGANGDVILSKRSVSFRLMRLNSPLDLVVNGRKANKSMQAFAKVGVEAKAS